MLTRSRASPRRARWPRACTWEHVAAPYQYLRIDRRRGVDEVFFGGRDRRTGVPDDPRDALASLEARFVARVPGVRVTHRWTGEIVETDDGLPYIGEIAPRRFVATGLSGTGLTFGTLAGMVVADALAGRANPWSAMFALGRTRGAVSPAGASGPSRSPEPVPEAGATEARAVAAGRQGPTGRLRPAPTLIG